MAPLLSICPSCGNPDTVPVVIDGAVLECVKCNHRFHPAGIDVNEIKFTADPNGEWGNFRFTLDRAKKSAEQYESEHGRKE